MSNFLTNALAKVLPASKKTPPPDASRDVSKKTPPPVTPVVVLFAWQSPTLNRQLLVAYKPDTDPTNPTNLVSVTVRSNHNFIRGMKLTAQLVPGTHATYNLVGPLPRWRGRM